MRKLLLAIFLLFNVVAFAASFDNGKAFDGQAFDGYDFNDGKAFDDGLSDGGGDDTNSILTESGDAITTEAGDNLEIEA